MVYYSILIKITKVFSKLDFSKIKVLKLDFCSHTIELVLNDKKCHIRINATSMI